MSRSQLICPSRHLTCGSRTGSRRWPRATEITGAGLSEAPMGRVATLGQIQSPARLGVGLLRSLLAGVPASRTDGAGAAHHPMGTGCVERHAAPLRSLYRLLTQRR